MAKGQSKRKYTAEFRQGVVALVLKEKRFIPDAAAPLGMPAKRQKRRAEGTWPESRYGMRFEYSRCIGRARWPKCSGEGLAVALHQLLYAPRDLRPQMGPVVPPARHPS
jgi:hypothetical protein